MSHELWAAYLTTVIDVTLPDGTRRLVGQVPDPSAGEWPFSDRVAWILTACNPRSVVLAPEVNAERHRQLSQHITDLGLIGYPNCGYDPDDPTWNEAGYTIVGSEEATVCALAREWEQNAVFRWAPDGFELVGVLLPGRNQHGWRWIR